MRIEPERALSLLESANPIPDPKLHRRRRAEALGITSMERRMATRTIARTDAASQGRGWKPAVVFVSVLVLAAASILAVASLRPDRQLVGELPRPPFGSPVDAVRAVVMAETAGDLEAMESFFGSGASVDAFGVTSLWDGRAWSERTRFRSGIGIRYLMDECRTEDGVGRCTLMYSDDLLAAAGLPDHAEEWMVTLTDDGRIRALRQRNLDTPELELANRWFVEFNQWICRNHPEEAIGTLWDLRTSRRMRVGEERDCTTPNWGWGIGEGAQPQVARSLHDLYLAEK